MRKRVVSVVLVAVMAASLAFPAVAAAELYNPLFDGGARLVAEAERYLRATSPGLPSNLAGVAAWLGTSREKAAMVIARVSTSIKATGVKLTPSQLTASTAGAIMGTAMVMGSESFVDWLVGADPKYYRADGSYLGQGNGITLEALTEDFAGLPVYVYAPGGVLTADHIDEEIAWLFHAPGDAVRRVWSVNRQADALDMYGYTCTSHTPKLPLPSQVHGLDDTFSNSGWLRPEFPEEGGPWMIANGLYNSLWRGESGPFYVKEDTSAYFSFVNSFHRFVATRVHCSLCSHYRDVGQYVFIWGHSYTSGELRIHRGLLKLMYEHMENTHADWRMYIREYPTNPNPVEMLSNVPDGGATYKFPSTITKNGQEVDFFNSYDTTIEDVIQNATVPQTVPPGVKVPGQTAPLERDVDVQDVGGFVTTFWSRIYRFGEQLFMVQPEALQFHTQPKLAAVQMDAAQRWPFAGGTVVGYIVENAFDESGGGDGMEWFVPLGHGQGVWIRPRVWIDALAPYRWVFTAAVALTLLIGLVRLSRPQVNV